MQSDRVDFNVSKQFMIGALILLLATLMVICFLQSAWFIKIILIFASISYGYSILFRYGLMLAENSIIAMTQQDSDWVLHEKNKSYPAKLCGSSTVTNYVCVLRFIIPDKRWKRVCLVFGDSFKNKAEFRKFFLKIVS